MTKFLNIPPEQWQAYLSIFSNENKGKLIALEYLSDDPDKTGFSMEMPLLSIDYDPPLKGNKLVINLGREATQFSHAVSAPIEFLEIQDESGKIMTLEISGDDKNKTIINLAK
jgi:hypothetical protein